MNNISRRSFLQRSTIAAGAVAIGSHQLSSIATAAAKPKGIQFGLVTYQWGKDFDLPSLIEVCEKAGLGGVETRTQHKHGVEPSLSKAERKEVKQRFANSPVTLVGYGSNAQYHDAQPEKLAANIELTKQYIKLMHDCGATGVKVKPNGFPKDLSREKTIEQIGKSLNQVAQFGADYGQQIRVEVHGKGTSDIEVMKAIFEVADHKNASICWNSNDRDLEGKGLAHNFNLLQGRFGKTVHVREFNVGDYPYAELMKLFVGMNYEGWILLEARTNPKDKLAALIEQRELFEKLIA